MSKNIITTLAILLFAVPLFAQKAVYVIFTSVTDNSAGVEHLINDKNNNPDVHRYPTQYFWFSEDDVYLKTFEYKNYNDEPDDPVLEEPLSFIKKLSKDVLYDWDVIMRQINTREEAEMYFDKFLNAKKLYFIDRRYIKDGKFQLVPVCKYGRRSYTTTYIVED